MSSEELERLAGSAHLYVRANVAQRSDLPEHLVKRLAGDKHKDVRRAVVGRPDLPRDVIERLAGDGDEWVRAAIVRRPGLPSEWRGIVLIRRLCEVRLARCRGRGRSRRGGELRPACRRGPDLDRRTSFLNGPRAEHEPGTPAGSDQSSCFSVLGSDTRPSGAEARRHRTEVPGGGLAQGPPSTVTTLLRVLGGHRSLSSR